MITYRGYTLKTPSVGGAIYIYWDEDFICCADTEDLAKKQIDHWVEGAA